MSNTGEKGVSKRRKKLTKRCWSTVITFPIFAVANRTMDDGSLYEGYVNALGSPHSKGKLYYPAADGGGLRYDGEFYLGEKSTGKSYDVNGKQI